MSCEVVMSAWDWVSLASCDVGGQSRIIYKKNAKRNIHWDAAFLWLFVRSVKVCLLRDVATDPYYPCGGRGTPREIRPFA